MIDNFQAYIVNQATRRYDGMAYPLIAKNMYALHQHGLQVLRLQPERFDPYSQGYPCYWVPIYMIRNGYTEGKGIGRFAAISSEAKKLKDSLKLELEENPDMANAEHYIPLSFNQ